MMKSVGCTNLGDPSADPRTKILVRGSPYVIIFSNFGAGILSPYQIFSKSFGAGILSKIGEGRTKQNDGFECWNRVTARTDTRWRSADPLKRVYFGCRVKPRVRRNYPQLHMAKINQRESDDVNWDHELEEMNHMSGGGISQEEQDNFCSQMRQILVLHSDNIQVFYLPYHATGHCSVWCLSFPGIAGYERFQRKSSPWLFLSRKDHRWDDASIFFH